MEIYRERWYNEKGLGKRKEEVILENTTSEIMQRMFASLENNSRVAVEKNEKIYSQIIMYLNSVEVFCDLLENEQIKLVMNEVCYDLISSVYMASNGMYRNAYICLRSAIELALAVLYFLDHNFDFLLWQENQYDVKWAVLNNKEQGVLSNRYLNLFCESNTDFGRFIEKVEDIYHNCSEYVHGKYSFMQTNFMQTKIKYDSSIFKEWSENWFDEVKVITLLLAIRLHKKLGELNDEIKKQLAEDAKDYELRGVFDE